MRDFRGALRIGVIASLAMAAGVVLALGSAGCDQTVKRTLPSGIRSVYVQEFSNSTDQAILPGLLLEELRREFRLDGRLTVMDVPAGADAMLDGGVVEYMRQPARFDQNNVIQEYRLRIVVDLAFKDLAKGSMLWEEKGPKDAATRGGGIRKLERYTNYVVVPASGIAVETEQDAQRRMVRELARDIVLRVIEGW